VITDHLRDVCRPFGVDICLKDPEQETLSDESEPNCEKYFLTVEGDDQPGILRHISGRLAEQQIDITDLYGIRDEKQKAFRIVLGLAVPDSVDVAQLQQQFQATLSQTFHLSVSFEHEEQLVRNHDALPGRVIPSVLKSPTAMDDPTA